MKWHLYKKACGEWEANGRFLKRFPTFDEAIEYIDRHPWMEPCS